jgi:hypothetical protein
MKFGYLSKSKAENIKTWELLLGWYKTTVKYKGGNMTQGIHTVFHFDKMIKSMW